MRPEPPTQPIARPHSPSAAARSDAFSLEDPSPVVRETLQLLRPRGLSISALREARS